MPTRRNSARLPVANTGPGDPKSLLHLTHSAIVANHIWYVANVIHKPFYRHHSCLMQAIQAVSCEKVNLRLLLGMRGPFDTEQLARDVAERLRVTRAALGYKTQASFAETAGILRTGYSPVENGTRLLSLQMALLLYDEFGITLDWLYRGDRSGLRASLRDEIRRIEREK